MILYATINRARIYYFSWAFFFSLNFILFFLDFVSQFFPIQTGLKLFALAAHTLKNWNDTEKISMAPEQG